MPLPKTGSRDDKELIFFARLFTLDILCDVIHNVIDKHVYVLYVQWWSVNSCTASW